MQSRSRLGLRSSGQRKLRSRAGSREGVRKLGMGDLGSGEGNSGR